MKAIEVAAIGGPEVLELVDLPDPSPGPGQVVVDVEAAGVNYADVMMRRGLYVGGPEPRFVPGFEVAGTISAAGEGVSDATVGQRVMAMTRRGGYAERAIADAATMMPLPEGFSAAEAAAFPVNFFTADLSLHYAARMQPGESVLVHAAAGGVGTAAVQLAKRAGARVFATASSREKLDRVAALGADELIDYSTEDFLEVVRDKTDGRGVDVILESVGGEVFEKGIKALAPLGRMVVIGCASSDVRTAPTIELLFRNLSVVGLHLTLLAQTPSIMGPSVARVFGLLAEGGIRPEVGHTLRLEEAARAHELLSDRANYGKIVLTP